jgi:hypothetical protein
MELVKPIFLHENRIRFGFVNLYSNPHERGDYVAPGAVWARRSSAEAYANPGDIGKLYARVRIIPKKGA